MTDRENWLRTVNYQRPEWIPCGVSFAPLAWHVHREALEDVLMKHPLLFPGYRRGGANFDAFGPVYQQGETFQDNWSCVWENAIGGLEGQVIVHPLADWSALSSYRPPDPARLSERGTRDWDAIRRNVATAKASGGLVGGDGERLFDRLYFLRGFQNLMEDIASDDPHLPLLFEMLAEYETKLIRMWLELEPDVMSFHTDIGTQRALMISPAKFRKYVKPLFAELFGMCRKAGALVYLSSDGHLLSIVDDLVECGVSVHDPQFRANGLDGIVSAYKGKLCANVDLDRQMFAFCQPEDIDRQVRDVVERMGDPQGGLMVAGSVWDAQTPIENIDALCTALERYCLSSKSS